jgi:hypothetical protein
MANDNLEGGAPIPPPPESKGSGESIPPPLPEDVIPEESSQPPEAQTPPAAEPQTDAGEATSLDDLNTELGRFRAELTEKGLPKEQQPTSIAEVRKFLEERESYVARAEQMIRELMCVKDAEGYIQVDENGNVQLTDIGKQLISDTPDLASIPELEKFINKNLKLSDPLTPAFADAISNPEFRVTVNGRQEKISLTSRKVMLERVLERIIGLPEYAPDATYNIGSWQAQTNVDEIRALSESNFPEDESHQFIKYVTTLIEMRRVAHELRRSLSLGESYKNVIQQDLKTRGFEFLSNEMVGVDRVTALYETYLGLEVKDKKTWLSHASLAGVDKRVRDMMMKASAEGDLKKHGRALAPWEIDRALAIGKTLEMGLQRTALYATLGCMPEGTSERLESEMNEIMGARALAPFKTYMLRFLTGGPDKTLGAARAFMKRILVEMKKTQKGSFFGIDRDSWNLNGWGATDALSSRWRNEFQFLADIQIGEGNNKTTLMQLLESRMHEVAKRDRIKGIEFSSVLGYQMSGDAKKKVVEALGNDRIMLEGIVGQRLYQMVLLRYDFLPEIAKQALFRKIAIMNPLTMSALRPDILDGLDPAQRAEWDSDSMRDKLVLANLRRVEIEKYNTYFEERADDKVVRRTQSMGDLSREAAKLIRFTRGGPELVNPTNATRYEMITARDDQGHSLYFGKEGLTPQQEAVLKQVIDAGVNMEAIDEAVKATHMPETLMINDVPRISWVKAEDGSSIAGITDEDMIRLQIYDGEGYRKAYEEGLKPLVERPDVEPVKQLKIFVDSLTNPDGEHTAQGKSEVIAQAWMKMCAMYPGVDWVSLAFTSTDTPKSEMEKFAPKSNLALNEPERAKFYDTFAREHILSDARVGGVLGFFAHSQLQRLKDETQSNRSDVYRRNLMSFLRILVAAFGLQFLSAMFSKKTLEEAGLA